MMPKYKLSGYIDDVISIEIEAEDDRAATVQMKAWEYKLMDELAGFDGFVYHEVHNEAGNDVIVWDIYRSDDDTNGSAEPNS